MKKINDLPLQNTRQASRFRKYVHERNTQMFEALINGMTYEEASDLFMLPKDSIRYKFKIYKRRIRKDLIGKNSRICIRATEKSKGRDKRVKEGISLKRGYS